MKLSLEKKDLILSFKQTNEIIKEFEAKGFDVDAAQEFMEMAELYFKNLKKSKGVKHARRTEGNAAAQ